MALIFLYSDPLGIEEPAVTTDLGVEVVRFGEVSFTQSADIGEPSGSVVGIDDPGAIYDFAGLRAVTVRETSAPSNNTIVWRGAIQDRRVSRLGSMRTGAGRHWEIDLVDYNWHLGKRILVDHDSKRPDETAGDRMRWLLASAAHLNLNDYGHVHYPNDQMEANDYRGQRAIDVLTDCAIETGYTFWCELNEAHGTPELFFLNPNGSSYSSTLRISNVYSDYDGSVTFLPYEDAYLTRSAERIAYGVYLAYANGSVYVRNDTTGAQFAKVDQSAPMSNVKHASRARRVATHFLNDNDEEDDRINCSIKVPVAQVNDIRAGHRLEVKFSHLPGYEDFVWCRVMRRTVIQDEEGGGYVGATNTTAFYRLALELSPTGGAGSVSCSTSVADLVTAEENDHADSAVSLAITPTAGRDTVIFGNAFALWGPTNMTATGANVQLFTHGTATIDHPTLSHMYRAVAAASGSYNVTATYGGDPGHWGAVAMAIQTSATTPVQDESGYGFNQTVTLSTPPTPGNLMVMQITVRDDEEISDVTPDGYWTKQVEAAAFFEIADDVSAIFTHCVTAGEEYVTFGGAGATCGVTVTEWEIT